jgi:hypothetical protein
LLFATLLYPWIMLVKELHNMTTFRDLHLDVDLKCLTLMCLLRNVYFFYMWPMFWKYWSTLLRDHKKALSLRKEHGLYGIMQTPFDKKYLPQNFPYIDEDYGSSYGKVSSVSQSCWFWRHSGSSLSSVTGSDTRNSVTTLRGPSTWARSEVHHLPSWNASYWPGFAVSSWSFVKGLQ